MRSVKSAFALLLTRVTEPRQPSPAHERRLREKDHLRHARQRLAFSQSQGLHRRERRFQPNAAQRRIPKRGHPSIVRDRNKTAVRGYHRRQSVGLFPFLTPRFVKDSALLLGCRANGRSVLIDRFAAVWATVRLRLCFKAIFC